MHIQAFFDFVPEPAPLTLAELSDKAAASRVNWPIKLEFALPIASVVSGDEFDCEAIARGNVRRSYREDVLEVTNLELVIERENVFYIITNILTDKLRADIKSEMIKTAIQQL